MTTSVTEKYSVEGCEKEVPNKKQPRISKQRLRKELEVSGKEYISRSGKTVPPRKLKQRCESSFCKNMEKDVMKLQTKSGILIVHIMNTKMTGSEKNLLHVMLCPLSQNKGLLQNLHVELQPIIIFSQSKTSKCQCVKRSS